MQLAVGLLTEISPNGTFEFPALKSDPSVLEEALDEAVAMIEASKLPVIVADVELKRYHLQKEFKALVDKTGIPFAVLMMGKTVIDESHPLFIGLYEVECSKYSKF
jgi:indolepyruvate decarboxylase